MKKLRKVPANLNFFYLIANIIYVMNFVIATIYIHESNEKARGLYAFFKLVLKLNVFSTVLFILSLLTPAASICIFLNVFLKTGIIIFIGFVGSSIFYRISPENNSIKNYLLEEETVEYIDSFTNCKKFCISESDNLAICCLKKLYLSLKQQECQKSLSYRFSYTCDLFFFLSVSHQRGSIHVY